ARDVVSAPCVGGIAHDSTWRNADLLTDCPVDRCAEGSAGGGCRVWSEPARRPSALSPCSRIGRPADRLSLGPGAETEAAGDRTAQNLRAAELLIPGDLQYFRASWNRNRRDSILVKLWQVAVCGREGHLP